MKVYLLFLLSDQFIPSRHSPENDITVLFFLSLNVLVRLVRLYLADAACIGHRDNSGGKMVYSYCIYLKLASIRDVSVHLSNLSCCFKCYQIECKKNYHSGIGSILWITRVVSLVKMVSGIPGTFAIEVLCLKIQTFYCLIHNPYVFFLF